MRGGWLMFPWASSQISNKTGQFSLVAIRLRAPIQTPAVGAIRLAALEVEVREG